MAANHQLQTKTNSSSKSAAYAVSAGSPKALNTLETANPIQRAIGNQGILYSYNKAPNVQSRLKIGAPNDKYEQEADRVADQVMENTTPHADEPAINTSPSSATLQRKCAACAEEEQLIQRKPSAESSGNPSPALLTGNGTALANPVRNFFEPRFGRSFADVRIHTGPEADHSARSINAGAYTVGSNIAFAAGRYRPDTFAGGKLLAHELTHVAQQGKAPARGVAQRAPLMVARGGRDDPNPPPPTPEPPKERPEEDNFICGPDVSTELGGVISSIDSTFTTTYTGSQKDDACDALDSVFSGALASWDVIELHVRDWIYQHYRPACATRGATPPCGQTVEVGNECYYGGTPNYVIFGKMCKLCHSHHAGTADANRFTRDATLGLVDRYKGPGSLLGEATNWRPSRGWAAAGYDGWPGGGTPPGSDRSHCDPSCSTTFPAATGPQSFRWRWCPHTDPAGQC